MRFLLLFGWSLLQAQAPYERIVNAAREPQNWLTYSGGYQGHRYSALTQINTTTVRNLKTSWMYQFESGYNQVSPIVVDGVMYVTGPNFAAALDARTGRSLWTWRRPVPKDLQTIGFGRTNRGAAILDDKIYVGTLDSYLVALDARTGAVRWEAKVADYKVGHCITVAPLAVKDKVIVGISGGEAGIRGFLDAYDAKTGKQLWRHWTIPAPGEPGSETWTGDAWKTGGAPTWVTGVYDPQLNLIYWGTGNPAPDWNGDVRPGDNLYSCSLLAIDANTGQRKWHFQFTPHDTHDWDATQVPMLVEAKIRGRARKLVATPNRNGFYYLLDRESGEFLHGSVYAKQTWAKGLDDKGRPILIPGMEPSAEGTLAWPSLQGATNWMSPSFHPQHRLVFVAVREMGAYYYKGEAKYKPGTFFAGGGERALKDTAFGAVRALDLETGKQRWEFRLHSPPWAGLLSTAGGLVFGGSSEGNFYALDALTGKPLWEMQTGASMAANPISYSVDGKQYIAVATGHVLLVFGL